MKPNFIAIIPARGGSKRLPGKNIRTFFGHPMLAYSVSAALHTNLFSQVIVSSDDALIGRIAEWYGATFFQRPTELAGDASGLVEVAQHVLSVLHAQGVDPDCICQLMPNCPLVRNQDILDQEKLFGSGGRSFQISVVNYRGVYPHWALVADEKKQGHWLLGERFLGRSQDLPEAVCPTGAIWWTRTKDFLSKQDFYGPPFYLAPMDANRGIDIDDEADLRLAELLVHGLTVRDGTSPLEPINRDAFDGEGPRD